MGRRDRKDRALTGQRPDAATAGGNALGTTSGAGRRAGNSRAPGRESGLSRDPLSPRPNISGCRKPEPQRMQMELHWSSQDAGSTPAGSARSWQVSSLSSLRLPLTASADNGGRRECGRDYICKMSRLCVNLSLRPDNKGIPWRMPCRSTFSICRLLHAKLVATAPL